jgi:hypothetical protein
MKINFLQWKRCSARRAFGVPTSVTYDQILWDHDAFQMILDCLREEAMRPNAEAAHSRSRSEVLNFDAARDNRVSNFLPITYCYFRKIILTNMQLTQVQFEGTLHSQTAGPSLRTTAFPNSKTRSIQR